MQKIDIYQCGVILFFLRFGQEPFTYNLTLNLLHEDPAKFWEKQEERVQQSISPSLKSLLAGMLHKNPSQRYEFSDIAENEWFNREIYTPEEFSDIFHKK